MRLSSTAVEPSRFVALSTSWLVLHWRPAVKNQIRSCRMGPPNPNWAS